MNYFFIILYAVNCIAWTSIDSSSEINFRKLMILNNGIESQAEIIKNAGTKRELSLKSRNGKRTLRLGVFLDEIVYKNLRSLYDDKNITNIVTDGLINQIQAIYYQKSLGQKVTFIIGHLEIFKKQPKELQMMDVEAFQVLTQFCKYQNEKKSNDKQWDMGIYFTGQDLFNEYNGKRSKGTMGLSTIEGVCRAEHSCVIGEFTTVAADGRPYLSSGFMAAYIMAHEMGHNLGMLHDGYGNECLKDGFLMSATRSNEGEVRWSNCSANTIKNIECLTDKKKSFPDKLKIKLNLVPGQTWDANDQCKLLLKDKEAKLQNPTRFSDICKSIKCVTKNRLGHFYAGPALDGTYCGPNKWCKAGQCVSSQDQKLKVLIGNWSEWSSGLCSSGCLQNSKGIIQKTRQCNNPKPVNNEFCIGDDTVIELCDDSKICGLTGRKFIKSEINKRCREYSKINPEITSEGQQMPYNKKKTWQSCAIYCRLNSTGVWYTPRYDVNDAKTETHLPDGSWCHNDNKQNYYCRYKDCQPEFNLI